MKTYLPLKKVTAKIPVICVALALAFTSISSCQKGTTEPEKPIEKIEVSSVTLDTATVILFIGDTAVLKATILPDSIKGQSVTWASSSEAVVKVDTSGKLTAVATGSAIITAKAGTKQAVCNVIVCPDVYVGGTDAQTATIWKNGVPMYFTNYPTTSLINSIFLSGGNVYATGSQMYGNYLAAQWKDNTFTPLTNASISQAGGNSIYVSGNDVYVAGYQYIASLTRRCAVWKNGALIPPTDDTRFAETNAVCVSGQDVYVAGDELIGKYYVATIWKNGVPTRLAGSSTNSSLSSIFVAGNDVYVAGNEDINSSPVATIWKNGTPVLRVASTTTKSAAFLSICVSGNDIYVAGCDYDFELSRFFPAIWKNGVITRLAEAATTSRATSIALWGSDVYVAGYRENDAILWVNGHARRLSKPGSSFSVANSIFLKQH